MMILQESLIDYIFLSRKVSLPLSALKIIHSHIPFSEIMNFSEAKFKSLLSNLKSKHKIPLRKIDDKVSRFINEKNSNTFEEIETELNICEKNEIKCLSFFDKEFPSLLRHIKRIPKFIFIKGEIKPEDQKAVAIIGTRKPTSYGVKMTQAIAKKLVENGFTIVSGFARGIDTIAIESALKNGGRAIGVLPSGILNIYPKENALLAKKLVASGALISEMFPNDNVTVRALQMRNRITSQLGLGNIFIEGTVSSGTKWQLKFGKEQERPPIALKPIGDYEQAHVPNKIINEEKGDVISDIEDMDYIIEMLINEYKERRRKGKLESKKMPKQTNLFKFG